MYINYIFRIKKINKMFKSLTTGQEGSTGDNKDFSV